MRRPYYVYFGMSLTAKAQLISGYLSVTAAHAQQVMQSTSTTAHGGWRT